MGKDKTRAPRQAFRWPLAFAVIGLVLGLASGIAYRTIESDLPTALVSLENAAGRLEAILEETDAFGRASRVARVFRDLPPAGRDESARASLAALRRVFERAHLYDGDIEFALFASWWARFDPRAAYEWRTYAPQGRGLSVLVAIAEEWGRSDLPEAIRTLRAEQASELRVASSSAALFGADTALVEDPEIIEALVEIADRSERRRALGVLLDRRLALNPEVNELIAWWQQIESPSSEIAQDLLASVATTVANTAPERAAALLSQQETAGADPFHAGALTAVAARWASTDPKATLEWLSSVDPDDEQSLAIRTSFQRWLLRDRPAALAWAAARIAAGDGDWLNPVRVTYGMILGYEDPGAGLRVLFELPIEKNRAWAVAQVFVKWKSTEPDAAEAWLQVAELSEFRKEQLRNLPVPTPPNTPGPNGATPRGEAS